MAGTKKDFKGTGFAAPVMGITIPKGCSFKNNKDGTVTIIHPKKTKTTEKPKKN